MTVHNPMSWKIIKEQIFSQLSCKIICLHGAESLSRLELQRLAHELKKTESPKINSKNRKVTILPSRDHYIRRHSHEGLFFQQRFQASWKDEGETVRQRLLNTPSPSDMETLKGLFGLKDLWQKPLLQLSSGEWQRYSLVEGLLTRPDFLVVPQLLKGLDRHWQHSIMDLLQNLPSPPVKIVFTSDLPVHHSAITNIEMESSLAVSNNANPEVPTLLKEKFCKYQNSFLFPSKEPLIEMEGVCIKYGHKSILQDIHWTVHAGEKWNIHGNNGAGKSTLLSLVNADNPQGYSQPIKLFGDRYGARSIWERKARTSFFGSDFLQYFRSSGSVADVIKQQLTTPYLDTPQPSDSLIMEVMNYFDLGNILAQNYATLPPTTRHQVLLAASYLRSSKLLVLDEPFQSMGSEQIIRNMCFLDSVQPESYQTLLFVTHRDDYRPRYLDKVIGLKEGRVNPSF